MDEFCKPVTILVADDDEDDRFMIKESLEEARLASDLYFVKDGEELMDYLYQRGKYSEGNNAPRPGLILLDLNMPRKDGREALREIKGDPALRHIPIVVLTTSKADDDIYSTYNLGVNSFITKPVSFEGLVDIMKTIRKYWAEIAQLPKNVKGV